MNYSEMTDFEINIEVAKATGHKPLDEANGWKGLQEPPFSAAICKGPCRIGGFNPCNSWTDAGPIIEKYSICIEKETSMCCDVCNDLYETGMWEAFHSIKHFCFSHSNPLRAAMIVFLMMQESV